MAQFWTGFAPVGYASESTTSLVSGFFQVYLAAPVVIIFYIVFKLVKKTKIRKTMEIDLVTGMRELNVQELIAAERAERETWPKYKKVWELVC